MDENTERKIRDLKLSLLKIDKELAATQSKNKLGAMLRAGNPAQIARASERDRKRLEDKRAEINTRLAALENAPAASALADEIVVAPAAAPKKTAAKKSAAAESAVKSNARKPKSA